MPEVYPGEHTLEEAFRRIARLEELTHSSDKHGSEHQMGGADEIIATKGLQFVAGDPDDINKSGIALFKNSNVPNLMAWIKMIQTGDLYINVPGIDNNFVVRFGDAAYKVTLSHDGLIFRLSVGTLTGAYLFPGAASNAVVFLGTNTDTVHFEIPGAGRFRRRSTYFPSYWTSVFAAQGPVTPTTGTLNTWTDVAGITGSLTTYGGNLWVMFGGGFYRDTNTGQVSVRLILDGTSDYYFPSSSGIGYSAIAAGSHQSFFTVSKLTGVAAGTYTCKGQIHDTNLANALVNSLDYWSLVVAED